MTGADAGAAGLLVVIGATAIVAATGAGGALVAGSVVHARTEAAADMVALAGAGRLLVDPDPCATAARVAGDNGVALASCEVSGAAVTVSVSSGLPQVLREVVGDRRATARSRAELVVAR